MRRITRAELAECSERELSALFREASQNLAESKASTPERRNALATLENISCERAARRQLPRPR